MRFFVGLHQPSDAQHFDAAFVSVNRLIDRKGPFKVGDWIMDSGAFSHMLRDGKHMPTKVYANEIKRWKSNGNLLAAVAQDLMCEPFILAKTGLTILDHQRMTIENYDDLLREETGCYILPVLQGYAPDDYVRHIHMYGDRLKRGMWVGVGSICKRNSNPAAIRDVLMAIKAERPDLRLHGFGLKTTALADGVIRSLLETADSMAWSFRARKEGRNGNDWREAEVFKNSVGRPTEYQGHFFQLLVENK
jgi:hypothetical protein